MDDNQTFFIEFDGEQLEARALTPDQISSLALVSGSGGAASLRIIGALIKYSLGNGAWETAATGLAAGTVKLTDIMELLKTLARESTRARTVEPPVQPQELPAPGGALDNHADVPATFRSGQ